MPTQDLQNSDLQNSDLADLADLQHLGSRRGSLSQARRHADARSLALLALLAAPGLFATGCRGGHDGRNPEGALELFIAAARTGDRGGAYQRLGPATRARIDDLAAGARKTSARALTRPEDFLSVGWALPAWEPDGMRTIERSAEAALVEVHSGSGDRHAVTMVKEGDEWKVELPAR